MNKRLEAIYDSASILFIQQGYSRTRINHIADSIGVSVGTIYHDFTSKKAVMQFVIKCTISPEFKEREIKRPISEDIFADLDSEIENTFDSALNNFAVNLSDSTYKFELFISDAFDLISRYAVCILFIEKNQYDFAKLADLHERFRTRFFNMMTKYFNRYIHQDIIRIPKYTEYAVLHIIETLTLWGMDMRYKNYNMLNISLETAKDVVLDNLVPAYLQ